MTTRRRHDVMLISALVLVAAILLIAQSADGGRLRSLLQPTAALVVFGGTAAALLVSFPLSLLQRTWAACTAMFRASAEPAPALIARFERYAVTVRKHGVLAIDGEIAGADDPFLRRALGLVADGVKAAELREALSAYSRAREESDEQCAVVLEAAAGYAPTLGILGAVLGLIRVMENLTTPASVGTGIAVAFVATVYGVAIANLVLLPLAARLRAINHRAALSRELIIEGAAILQQRVHPRLIEIYLGGYVQPRLGDAVRGAA